MRLSGIDTPERGQPFGTKAKQALSEKVFGKDVTLNSSGKDRYGRTLGEIILDGESVNVWLVRGGWAWWYERYAPDDTQLRDAQQAAQQQILAYGLIRIRCRRGTGGGASVEGPQVGG